MIKNTTLKLALAFVSFLFLLSFVSSIPIPQCGTISSPGVYTLSNSLVVYSQNITSGKCISILASNVSFDCQGYKISDYSGGNNNIMISSNSLNTTIKNCNMVTYYGTAISLSGASNSQVVNTTFSGYAAGLLLTDTDNSSFYNLSSSDGTNIIKVSSGSDNNVFYDLNLNGSKSLDLVYIYRSNNNTFYNFNFVKSNGYSILLQYSNDNVFYNGNINSSVNYGIYLESGLRNAFRNVNFKGLNSVIYSFISVNTSIIDSTFDPTYKMTLSSSGGSIAYLVNSTHLKSFENVLAGTTLYNGLYLDLSVINSSGYALSSANINAYDSARNLAYSGLTDAQGKNRAILYEYSNIGGATSYYGNYVLNVSKAGYPTSSQSLNMSGNKNVIVTLSASPPAITNYHPADTEMNWTINANEFTAYNRNFKLQLPDSASAPSVDYYSRANYLFKMGEKYHFDSLNVTCNITIPAARCWLSG